MLFCRRHTCTRPGSHRIPSRHKRLSVLKPASRIALALHQHCISIAPALHQHCASIAPAWHPHNTGIPPDNCDTSASQDPICLSVIVTPWHPRHASVTPLPHQRHNAIQCLVRGSAMIWLCQQKYSAAIQASHLYQTIVTPELLHATVKPASHCPQNSAAPASRWPNTFIPSACTNIAWATHQHWHEHHICITTRWLNVTPALHK